MEQDTNASEHARALAARRRKAPGRCVVCGKEFVATSRRAYCSKNCKNHAEYERRNARRQREEHQP